jgi:superfamily II DNA or RNA helicase
MPKFQAGTWDGYISLYKRQGGTLPGGLMARTVTRLQELGVDVDIEDRSQSPLAEPELAGGQLTNIDLRPYQEDACNRAEAAKRGVFDAATGTGKTEIMAEMIRRLACRSLIIVASRDLAWQTIRRFQGTDREAARLAFPNADPEHLYGIVGDDVDSPGLITAALYQTLVRRLEEEPEATREWLATFDALHLDECHRSTAKTWWPVVNAIPAYWRFGYSATPTKSDPITELKLTGATGEIFYSFKAKEAIEEGWLTEPFVVTVDSGFPAMLDEEMRYIDVYRDGIADHAKRNRLIAEIARGTAEGWGVPTLILVTWSEHGRNIRRALREIEVRAEFVSGTDSTEKRLAVMEALQDGRLGCAISTTIFDEGVNVPEIGALILAGGGKAHHKVIQRIGRGLRVVEGKDYLAVFDFLDSHSEKYLLGHSRQRLRAVQDAGFAQETLTPKQLLDRMESGDVRSG